MTTWSVCVCSIALFMLLQQLSSSLIQKLNKMSLHHVISSRLIHTEHFMIVIMALKPHLTSAELLIAYFCQWRDYACVHILLKPLIIPRQTFFGRDFQSLVQTMLSLLFNTSTCPLIEKSFTLRIILLFWSKCESLRDCRKIICQCKRVVFLMLCRCKYRCSHLTAGPSHLSNVSVAQIHFWFHCIWLKVYGRYIMITPCAFKCHNESESATYC